MNFNDRKTLKKNLLHFQTQYEYHKEFLRERKVFSPEKNNKSTDDIDNDGVEHLHNVKDSVQDFLKNTTLHGLKYTASEELSVFERAFFVLSFFFVIVLSAYFISNVYIKWTASPLIISTSPSPTFTTSIPFPSITICNLNQVKKSKVKDLKEGTYNYTLLWSLCTRDIDHYLPTYLGNWKNFRPVLLEMAQPCNEMLLYCQFGGKTESCKNLFNSVLTDDGLCCNFNSVDPSFMVKNFSAEDRFEETEIGYDITPIDWTPEKGYPDAKYLPTRFFPRIARGTGKEMGLTITLNASSDEYFCSTSKGFGFKILVHNPIEQPKIKNYGFLVNMGREVRANIKPSYSDATTSIRQIDRRVRHCLFSDEGNLTYYRTYSRKNCEQECVARILIQECGCVLYYLPRLTADVKICGPSDNKCTKQVQTSIEQANTNLSCENCYPACFELGYRLTLSSVTIVDDDFYSNEMDLGNYSKELSVVHFFYGNNFFRSNTKDEIIGFTEFLSNTGGLLGLFMGFSIFSIIEIIYYMSLRPYCNYRRYQKSRNNENIFDKQNVNGHLDILYNVNDSWKPRIITTSGKNAEKENVNFNNYSRITSIRDQKSSISRRMLAKARSSERVFPSVFPYYE